MTSHATDYDNEHHKIYLKSVLFSVSEKETNFSITPRICKRQGDKGAFDLAKHKNDALCRTIVTGIFAT